MDTFTCNHPLCGTLNLPRLALPLAPANTFLLQYYGSVQRIFVHLYCTLCGLFATGTTCVCLQTCIEPRKASKQDKRRQTAKSVLNYLTYLALTTLPSCCSSLISGKKNRVEKACTPANFRLSTNLSYYSSLLFIKLVKSLLSIIL